SLPSTQRKANLSPSAWRAGAAGAKPAKAPPGGGRITPPGSPQTPSEPPLVTIPPHSVDVGGILGIVLDLQPQAADIHIHDLQLAEVVPAPDHVQDLLPGEGLPRVLHEHLHDGVLHL